MNNQEWISVVKIARELNLHVDGQVQKVQKDPRFTTKRIKRKGLDNKFRETICIPLDQVELFRSSINPNRTKKVQSQKQVYTYIIWDGKSDFIKIGKSNNPLDRLKKHQTAHKSLQIIYLIEGDKEEFFNDNYHKYRIDKKTEHYWLVPQIIQAWKKFEDVNDRFF